MEVGTLVTGKTFLCGPQATLQTVAQELTEHDIGSLVVVDKGRIAGLITERDLVRAAAEGVDWGAEPCANWMTPDPDIAAPDLTCREAAEWLAATGYRHLPIADGSELLGVVSVKDVLWELLDTTNSIQRSN